MSELKVITEDLAALCEVTSRGPQWGTESEDLNLTLLSWNQGQGVASHVNDEVDVVWLGISGEGEVSVDEKVLPLRPGVVILIPKGCRRAVKCTSARLSYLSVHRRRRGLMPVIAEKRLSS